MRRIFTVWLCAMMMVGSAFIGMTLENGVGGGDANPEPRVSYTITNVWELQNMSLDLTGDYTLINDIDASITSSWNAGAGFDPVATDSNPFTGKFEGQNYTISGLYINRPSENCVGLLAYLSNSAQARNVRLEDVNITGYTFVAGFIGRSYTTTCTVSNCYVTGVVRGRGYCIGGFVGETSASMSYCYADCTVSGIVAGNNGYIGGFAGDIFGPVSNCYATGDVSASGASNVGGFTGYYFGTSTLSNCYSTGDVPDTGTNIGGFVGFYSGGTFTDCFWDTDMSGTTTGIGSGSSTEVQGKTTPEMMQQATFTTGGSNWDFTNIWHMTEGITYPLFQWQDLPVWCINLQAGWNLISVPLQIGNTSISNVLAGISEKYDCVKYFDALDVTDPWKTYRPSSSQNDLASIDITMGLWVHTTEACTLNVTGMVPASTAIDLHAGWNLVGYPSMSERAISVALAGTGYDRVEGFMPATPYVQPLSDSYMMKPGEGYWIHVPADTVWTVDW